MRQGIQKELPDKEVNNYGCLVLCYIAIAEHKAGLKLTDEDVMRGIIKARERGWIGKDCEVIMPHLILADFSELPPGAFDVLKTYSIPAQRYYAICNRKPDQEHFTAMIDGALWDPLPPERSGNRGYQPYSYRAVIERV